jgi:hypothetical protein
VLRVTYDTSLKKIVKLQASIGGVQDELAAQQAEAESRHRQGHTEAQRSISACAYLARVLQHIADKVSLWAILLGTC